MRHSEKQQSTGAGRWLPSSGVGSLTSSPLVQPESLNSTDDFCPLWPLQHANNQASDSNTYPKAIHLISTTAPWLCVRMGAQGSEHSGPIKEGRLLSTAVAGGRAENSHCARGVSSLLYLLSCLGCQAQAKLFPYSCPAERSLTIHHGPQKDQSSLESP